jgi:putative hydrolase
MIEADLHVHSLFSDCGLHTYLELLERAHHIGLKAIAVTDHGLTLGGRLTSTFFDRLKSPYADLTLYKGIELNVLDEQGKVDLPRQYLPHIDILLLGLHPNLAPLSRERNTGALIAAIEKNHCIDIISHPNDPVYPVDYARLAQAARRAGVALELNNSKILYSRSTVDDTLKLVQTCKEIGCLMAVNSDTHAILELGDDSAVRPLLDKVKFPEELIVNRTAESAAHFIEGRRGRKKKAVAVA